jgi:hypothetical protein
VIHGCEHGLDLVVELLKLDEGRKRTLAVDIGQPDRPGGHGERDLVAELQVTVQSGVQVVDADGMVVKTVPT